MPRSVSYTRITIMWHRQEKAWFLSNSCLYAWTLSYSITLYKVINSIMWKMKGSLEVIACGLCWVGFPEFESSQGHCGRQWQEDHPTPVFSLKRSQYSANSLRKTPTTMGLLQDRESIINQSWEHDKLRFFKTLVKLPLKRNPFCHLWDNYNVPFHCITSHKFYRLCKEWRYQSVQPDILWTQRHSCVLYDCPVFDSPFDSR